MGYEGIRGRTGARAWEVIHIYTGSFTPSPDPTPFYRRLISTRKGGLTTNGIHLLIPASLSNRSGPPQSGSRSHTTVVRQSIHIRHDPQRRRFCHHPTVAWPASDGHTRPRLSVRRKADLDRKRAERAAVKAATNATLPAAQVMPAGLC